MPDQSIKTQETLRYIHRSHNDPKMLPGLDIESIDIYKGEILVNTSNENPGIYIRTGETDNEFLTDKLVRIGNVQVSDVDPLEGNSQLDPKGVWWYKADKGLLYLHTGQQYVRVNSVQATEETLGEAKVATFTDLLQGTSVTTMVTPERLEQWRDYYGFVSRKKDTFQLYVDLQYGDDSLENDGSDPYRPFLTVARAAVEVARRSYNYPEPSFYKQHTIYVFPGQHFVDNRRGVARYISLPPLGIDSKGPINPQPLDQVVLEVDLTAQIIKLNARTEIEAQQIWALREGEVVGSAIISRDVTFDDEIPVRNIKGSWLPGDKVLISDLYLLNPPTGGVILPRGCSLIALDPDKTVIRPKYVSNSESPLCSIFKVTNGCYINGIVFTDSIFDGTHQRCSAVEYVAKNDLVNIDYGYYPKLYYIFANTQLPALLQVGLTALPSELANNDLGYSIAIDNCVVKSYYGMNGFVFEYGAVNGNNEVLLKDLKIYTEQLDRNAYVSYETKEYKQDAKNYAIKADGNVVVKLANSHIKGAPESLVCNNGGRQYVTSTYFTDVQTLAVSRGSLPSQLLKELGGKLTAIIPPKYTPTAVSEIQYGWLNKDLTTATKIYVERNAAPLMRYPYTLQKDELVYVRIDPSNEYSARFIEAGVDYINGEYVEYLLVSSELNEIFSNLSLFSDVSFVHFKRPDDRRLAKDKLYWFEITDVRATAPVPGLIMKSSTNEAQFKTYIVAAVEHIESNTYRVAFVLGGDTDLPYNLYPEVNVPALNTNTKNKEAAEWLLRELGYNELDITETLLESSQGTTLITQPRVEFVEPSIIDIRGGVFDQEYPTLSAYGGVVKLG
jgi:hypothetical protein